MYTAYIFALIVPHQFQGFKKKSGTRNITTLFLPACVTVYRMISYASANKQTKTDP